MTTSNTYTFNPTLNEIIERAYRICRVLRYGQNLTNEHLAAGKQALNGMQKAWQAEGIKLWMYNEEVSTLTASSTCTHGGKYYKCIRSHTSASATEPGTGAQWELYWYETGSTGAAWVTATAYVSIHEIALDASVFGLEYVYLRDGEQDEPPLQLLTKAEYDGIAIKHIYAKPSAAYFDYAKTKKLYLYPMPDATTYLIIAQVITKLMDVTGVSHTTDFPQHWIDAIIYGLADNLCDEYGQLLPADKSRLRSKAIAYKETAKRLERPTVNTQGNFVKGIY